MFKRYKAPGWNELIKALRSKAVNTNAVVELGDGTIVVCLIDEEAENATVLRRVRHTILYPDTHPEKIDIPSYAGKKISALLFPLTSHLVVEKEEEEWVDDRMRWYTVKRYRVHSDTHIEEIPLVQEVE